MNYSFIFGLGSHAIGATLLNFDPSPFGMQIKNRAYTSGDKGYRYGFNRMERDDEIKGEGNSLDFGARIYDSRLGRWFTVDPYAKEQSAMSPYSYCVNIPIVLTDHNGEYPKIAITSEITGYTLAKVYGSGKVTAIIVPTYKMIIYDVNEKGEETVVGTHNVTRDGWYNQGIGKDGNDQLVNRTTEPIEGVEEVEVGAIPTVDYGDTKGAYALEPVTANPTPASWYTNTAGDPVPTTVVRSKPGIATSVMIHIGGVYTTSKGETKLGGTYGCFGVVSEDQVFETEKEATKFAKKMVNRLQKGKEIPKGISTSNQGMNNVVHDVNSAIKKAKDREEKNSSEIKVVIKKRAEVLLECECYETEEL